jgi:hypothetical protein
VNPSSGTYLHKMLQREPSAPLSRFEEFIVGPIQRYRTLLRHQLDKMIECHEPSCVQLILGPNGNGKTLLNNTLKQAASATNVSFREEGVSHLSYDVLFSWITLSGGVPAMLGIELAKNLQRSIYEPPEVTYSSIATQIAKRFANDFVPPFHIRIASWIPKYLIKKAIREYEVALKGVITSDEADPISEALTGAFDRIQKALSRASMRRAFSRYVSDWQMSSFMERFLDSSESHRLSIRDLNESLYSDLDRHQATAQPLDSIRAIASIGKDVGCKVVVLMLDDVNLVKPPRILLPIVESLREFRDPKIFLVVTAIEEVWKTYTKPQSPDRSIYEKIEMYGNPIVLGPPTPEQIPLLFQKLLDLMNNELSCEGKWVAIDESEEERIIQNCSKESFRAATKFMIDSLETHVRVISGARTV